MSIKKIISGICGIVLGFNCMTVRAEDTSSVVQRVGWNAEANTQKDYHHVNYTFYSYVYSSNKVEITCQCSKSTASDPYIIESLIFIDSIYNIEIQTDDDRYWDNIISFDNNNIVYSFNRKTYFNATGSLITITLTPKYSFTEETTITAFGQEIIINSGNAEPQKADFNQDGAVNAEDAALILQYSGEFGSGFTELTFDEWSKQTIPNSES